METIKVLVIAANLKQHVPCNVITFLTTSLIYQTQAMMDCLVSPPQPGDESYDTFIKVSVRL